LSEHTFAWQLYLGIFFVLLVMFAPGGLAGLIASVLTAMRSGYARTLRGPGLSALVAVLLFAVPVIILIEMTYGISWSDMARTQISLFGVVFDAANPVSWLVAAAWAIVATILLWRTGRTLGRAWADVQARIADDIQKGRA